jgi:hypothetical protein
MYRLLWLAAFVAIFSLYWVDRMWPLAAVGHATLVFAWLVVAPGKEKL